MDVDLGNGYRAEIEIEQDNDMGPPWEEHDGHGVIVEGYESEKQPGWRKLAPTGTRDVWRWYDVQASMEIAKRDWVSPKGEGTKGQRAAKAVETDFQHMQDWCEDRWYWVGYIVKVYDKGDRLVGDDSLWGIDDEEYAIVEAKEQAKYIVEKDMERRHDAWRSALREAREARAWAARDVRTI